jgi:hypothetical protein
MFCEDEFIDYIHVKACFSSPRFLSAKYEFDFRQ